MSVGILIVTHGTIGQSVLDTATEIIGSSPVPVKTISVEMDCDYDSLIKEVNTVGASLNTGDGILLLTDLFGATPSNIAGDINIPNCIMISGLNLPMLIRVMNYHTLPLYELGDKAIGGGQDGILAYYPDKDNEAITS